MARRNVVTFREFLNLPEDEGTATVRFKVSYKPSRVNAVFSIRDCSHEAILSFYWSAKKPPKNELHKIEILKQAVLDFEEAYHAAVDKRLKYLARKKKEKAQK